MRAPTQTSSRDLMASIRRVFSSRDSHMTLILILAIVVAAILVPRFSQPRTLTFLTLDVTATLLMALPMTLVIDQRGHRPVRRLHRRPRQRVLRRPRPVGRRILGERRDLPSSSDWRAASSTPS